MIGRYRGTEVDTAGDGFFATFDGPARAVRCALAIVEAVRPIGLEVRAGVHTGEVELIDDKVGGIAVNIGARVAAHAEAVGGARLTDGQGPGDRVRPLVRGRRRARAQRCARPLAPLPGDAVVIPDVHYAKTNEGVHIAYQVMGEGPMDLVLPGPGYSNIDYMWRLPTMARFFRRLGAISRLIIFDPRGQGLSDPISGGDLPTLESRMEDTLSVMEAAGSERAALWGSDSTGPLAILFAATYPERTAALIVYGSFARGRSTPDYPWAWSDERWDERLLEIENRWGQPDYIEEYYKEIAPTAHLDRALLETWVGLFRATSPGTALAFETMERETDIRNVLPAVHVPT